MCLKYGRESSPEPELPKGGTWLHWASTWWQRPLDKQNEKNDPAQSKLVASYADHISDGIQAMETVIQAG